MGCTASSELDQRATDVVFINPIPASSKPAAPGLRLSAALRPLGAMRSSESQSSLSSSSRMSRSRLRDRDLTDADAVQKCHSIADDDKAPEWLGIPGSPVAEFPATPSSAASMRSSSAADASLSPMAHHHRNPRVTTRNTSSTSLRRVRAKPSSDDTQAPQTRTTTASIWVDQAAFRRVLDTLRAGNPPVTD
jgi:hypothetical protein